MADKKTLIIQQPRKIYVPGVYQFEFQAEILKQMEGQTYKILKVRLRENGDNVADPEIDFELITDSPTK